MKAADKGIDKKSSVKHSATNFLKHPAFMSLVFCLWVVAIVLGFGRLLNYGSQPGMMTKAPLLWPSDSHIESPKEVPVFLMLAHPKCPCSKASIRELEKLMVGLQGKVRAYVLFSKPKGFSDDEVKSSLWNNAARIPGVQVLLDSAGEAKIFGAQTSGESFLYDKDGALVFHGGITGLRGHEGPNRGQQAVLDAVLSGKKAEIRTSAFGCPLNDPVVRKDSEL